MIDLRSIWLFSGIFFTVPPLCAGSVENPHIFVIVSLVDNASQGIEPVPPEIGDGDSPHTNLYWGAAYGVKTFLSKAEGWRNLWCERDVDETVLERCRFTWKNKLIVTADAYRGSRIKQAMLDFMQQAATPPVSPAGEMVVFIGHNGLMDEQNRSITKHFPKHARHDKQAVVLACMSERYFAGHLLAAGSNPSVTTFGLMAPEAYVLEAIARGFANKTDEMELRRSAGAAYAKYQHISIRSGKSIFGAFGVDEKNTTVDR